MNKQTNELRSDMDDEFGMTEDDELADTVALSENSATDNVGDSSVEINVEKLIADFEQSEDKVSARKKEVRRRLEELAEDNSFEDTYEFDFNEEDNA